MNRIRQVFDELQAKGHKALIGYLTAGDPTMKMSEQNIRAALENGVDVLELGVPFSDPTADGPTIQAAGQRALKSGTTLRKVMDLARRLRASYRAPIILFSYVNPLFAYGYKKLAADAAAAGVDGVLVVDLPFEESAELRRHLREQGLMFIQLVAPTTSPARIKMLLAEADGFVYYILVKGVTGARDTLATDFRKHLALVKTCTDIPIAVGFGISSGPQAFEAALHADAVVVGSALVQAAHEKRLPKLVRELAAAVHRKIR